MAKNHTIIHILHSFKRKYVVHSSEMQIMPYNKECNVGFSFGKSFYINFYMLLVLLLVSFPIKYLGGCTFVYTVISSTPNLSTVFSPTEGLYYFKSDHCNFIYKYQQTTLL